MSFRKIILLVSVFFSAHNVFSQNPNLNPKISVPSPEASAFMKYGNYPVDYSTGVPKIEIPIYDIKSGSLSLPVSLSYHAGGIKVNDIASSAGLGWTLKAGGMVSRVMNQKPDEFGLLQGNNVMTESQIVSADAAEVPNPNNRPTLNYVRDVYFGLRDTKSDDYSYSVGDKLSGKFIYDVTKSLHHLSFTNNKVVRTPQNTFEITGEDGTRYIFDEKENVSLPNESAHPTSWFVTKMISFDNVDTIQFEYTSFPFGYSLVYESQFMKDGSDGTEPYYNSSGPFILNKSFSNSSYNSTILLSKIKFRNGSVSFNYESGRQDIMEYRLSSVVLNVIRGGVEQQLKRILFIHSYFLSSFVTSKYDRRLKLDEVKHYDQNNSYVNSYKFQYNTTPLPSSYNYTTTWDAYANREWMSCDYWGYYNGKTNTHLLTTIPSNPMDVVSADRSSSEFYMKAGILERIDFPTGGFTSFEFEVNRIPSLEYLYPTGVGGLRVKKITSKAYPTDVGATKSYIYADAQMVSSIGTGQFSYTMRVGNTIDPHGFSINTYYDNSISPVNYHNGSPVLYTNVAELMESSDGRKEKTEYAYEFFSDREYNVVVPRFNNLRFANLDWSRGNLLSTTYYRHEANTFKKLKAITYSYDNFAASTIRTGLEVYRSWSWASASPNDYLYVFYYEPIEDCGWSYFCPQTDIGIRKLSTVSEVEYDNSENITMSTQKTYSYTGNGHLYPSSITFTNSKQEVVSSQMKYPNDLVLTGDPETARQQLVLKNNVSALLEEKQLNGVAPVSLSKTSYKDFGNGVIRPYEIQKQIGGFSIETEAQMTKYDSRGNLLQYRKPNDLEHSYIWGYNKTYPIAVAVNANENEIFFDSFEEGSGWDSNLSAYEDLVFHSGKRSGRLAAQSFSNSTKTLVVSLTTATRFKYSGWVYSASPYPSASIYLLMKNPGEQASYTYLDQITSITPGIWVYVEKEFNVPASVTQISLRIGNASGGDAWFDDIRLHRSTAQMNTYTYDPLVGLLSQADINNRFTFYEYDAFSRLRVVRDHDRNIIKKNCYNYFNQLGNCDPIYLYVKITPENVIYSGNYIYGDVVLRFYQDAACTVPASASNLAVNVKKDYYSFGGDYHEYETYSFLCNGTATTIRNQIILQFNDSDAGYMNTYLIEPGNNYEKSNQNPWPGL